MTPADDAALDWAAAILALRAERMALRFDMGLIEAGERLADLADVRAAVRAHLAAWKHEQLAQLRVTLLVEPQVGSDRNVAVTPHLSDARDVTIH